ncbi:hypothetical protein GHT06_014277 [Daphnia sinensis]|uniref:Uncharacterized protein n=1 Tax=Daphnia sinensis TaxID=1820382 RepID=A0AAD5KTJ4_9CRUS|nr:hypothetical protein GHT06_014277 [Daphnia sinensis]
MQLKRNVYYFPMHVHIRLYLIESPKVVHTDLFLEHAIYLIRYLIMNCTGSRKEVTGSYTKPTTRFVYQNVLLCRILFPKSSHS